MRISVIGTNGMLSTCLSKEFLRLGHVVETYGLDKPEYPCSAYYETDLLKDEIDYSRVIHSDVIIYASGAGVQAALNTDPSLMYRLNVFAPVMMTRQLKNHGYRGIFISFGTYMEIGLNDDPEAVFTEEEVICSGLRVTNDYALSKRLFGRYINDFTADFTFWHFILPNMFSRDDIQPGTRLIPYVLGYLLRYRDDPGCPLPSFSSGSQLRQYIRMEDIVVVIGKAIEHQMQSGVYNIGGGEYLSVRELIERLFHAYEVPFNAGMFGKEQRRDGDVKCLHISGKKLFEKIHFLPSVKIDDVFPARNNNCPMVHSPVLFITFARPEYARPAFDSIKQAKPGKLYFYSNKGRSDRPGEIERNDRIRAFIGEIDWDCELKIFFREEHADIYTSLWGAIDWIFSNEEDAIILEEDCVASPAFFSFCDNLLSRYRDEPKVWMISGDNFTPRGNPDGLSYFFSCFAHIYGWASWADRWRKLDRKMETWPETKNSRAFRSYFNNYFIAKYTRIRFDFIYKRLGAFNPWDYIFSFNMMKNHGYAVVPAVNLVNDIGSQGEHHPGYLKTRRDTGDTGGLPEEFKISAEPQQIETTRYDRYHLGHHIIWPLIKRKSLRLIFFLVKRGG